MATISDHISARRYPIALSCALCWARALRRVSGGGFPMPRGDKRKYTDKQKRQAEHIEEGYKERGMSSREAERAAWATVNAVHGGGEKRGGSGYGKPENHEPMRKGGRKGGRASGGADGGSSGSAESGRSTSKRG